MRRWEETTIINKKEYSKTPTVSMEAKIIT